MFEVGKLYYVSGRNLLLYPDLDSARRVNIACANYPAIATDYWTNELTKPVKYVNDIFMVLNEDCGYIQIISGESIGWIVLRDWIEFKEMRYGLSG